MCTRRKHSGLRQGGWGWNPVGSKENSCLFRRWAGRFGCLACLGPTWAALSAQTGLDLAQLHEKLKAIEAHVRASCVTEATFPAKLRSIRTVLCGAVGPALSGVVGAGLGVGL